MATETNEAVKQETKKRNKYLLVIAFLAVGIIAGIYLYNVAYYLDHFLPHTYVNSVECSNLSVTEVKNKVADTQKRSYALSVKDDDEELFVVSPEDAGMIFDATAGLEQLIKDQNPFLWPLSILSSKKQDNTIKLSMAYNEEALNNYLGSLGILKYTDDKKPRNAYIGTFDPNTRQFEIVPEQRGYYILEDDVRKLIVAALNNQQKDISVSAKICRKTPKVTSSDKELIERLNCLNTMACASITYDWNGTSVLVDGETIRNWIIEEDGTYRIDEEQVASFVAEMADKYDTYGKERTFKTIQGEELILPGGAYGWRTDQKAETEALLADIMAGGVVEREPVFDSKGYVKGANDIGTSYVEIDLTNQHLYLILDGEVELESDFVSGDISKRRRTPPGVFGITYKKKNAVLRGADYETPVNYWMPFNRNIGMHDATWRRSFGGEIYKTNGSHGCINLPKKSAASIYEYMEKNFPVVCYYY